MNSRKALTFPSLLGILLSIALFGILIAGCGSSTVGAAPTTPNSTTANVQHCGAIIAPSAPGGPTGCNIGAAQKCGAINIMRTMPNNAKTPGNVNANVAGSCFWQSFQQCRAASLIVNFGGIDTITTHTFTLQKKNTSCTISDAVQNRVVPQPARNTGTYTCSGLVNAANELHFNGCGKLGTIIVPITQVGYSQ
jgi:hypothetical protein